MAASRKVSGRYHKVFTLQASLGVFVSLLSLLFSVAASSGRAAPPDVLFIAIDDLNDWTTLFDRANPIKTPNLERLAARGCLFTRAYCAAPGCNPSRTAIMTGLRPTTSGVYDNNHFWRRALPTAVTLPQYFAGNSYRTRAAGKILHHGKAGGEDTGNTSFQEFLPFPMPPDQGYKSHIPYLTGSFNWGAEDGRIVDENTVDWALNRMKETRQQPQFLAAGLFHPHLPHVAPSKFFELYPLAGVKLPPMPADDLDDIPPLGIKFIKREYSWSGYLFTKPPPDEDPGSLKKLVQSYQASASYADSLVGRLLDGLDASGREKNTIIVLWSDHGYHLGDKQSVIKFTLWEKATHVPLIIVAPGVTKPGSRCDQPVGLVDVFPTLLELASLTPKTGLDGKSLVPLLQRPGDKWDRPALTTHGRGNHAVRSRDWRYIRYSDGREELYDKRVDPWDHTNLIGRPEFAGIVSDHARWLPANEAPAGPTQN